MFTVSMLSIFVSFCFNKEHIYAKKSIATKNLAHTILFSVFFVSS